MSGWSRRVSTVTPISPLAAMRIPQGRPREVPADGQLLQEGLCERHHPLAGEGILEADRLAVGDDDMGVMEQSVDECRGDRLVHQLVEA